MNVVACKHLLTNVKKLRILLAINFGFYSLLYFFQWWFEGEGLTTSWHFVSLAIAVIYGFVQLVGNWILYLAAYNRSRTRPALSEDPRVDILITAYKEEYKLVCRCLEAACSMRGNHRVWLLDDGNDPDLAHLAQRLGVEYITRSGNKDAKAGNINHALPYLTGDIVAIFDIDHAPKPDFLEHTLIHFENPDIGFVQVMLTFENDQDGWVAQAGAESSLDFYNPTSIGADGIGSATLVGSNALIRRDALLSIGGYCPGLAEDLATSITLHAAGWRSLYVRKPLAPGFAPPDLAAWFTQQLKWARGVFEELLTSYWRYFPKLNIGQRVSYVVRMTYYWLGIIVGIHLIATIHVLWQADAAMLASYQHYLWHLAPLSIMTIIIRQLALHRWFHPSMRSIQQSLQWRPIALVYATWPVYLLAWLMAVCRLPLHFRATPKTKSGKLNLWWLLPQGLTSLGLLIGLTKSLLLMNGQFFWLVYGFALAQICAQLPVFSSLATLSKTSVTMKEQLSEHYVSHEAECV